MRFNGSDSHHVLLRDGLIKCYEDPGKKKSFRDIILAMTNFAITNPQKLPGLRIYSHQSFEALRKTCTRLYYGHRVQDDGFKATLWDYLVYDNYIKISDFPDSINVVAINLSNFFKQDGAVSPLHEQLGKRYFAYKKAIRDPEKMIIKFMVSFSKSELSDSLFHVLETHINRSYTPAHTGIMEENWEGCAFLRRNSLFVILREERNGSPRSYNLHSPQINNDIAVQILGDSIECVENWGNSSNNYSRVILELIPDETTDAGALKECDLINRKYLEGHSPHITDYIYG